MGKSKPRGKYQSVSLPVGFIKEIFDQIQDDDRYKSIADYVRQSVREKMQRDHSEAMEKEPVVQLSKSELTDMIRNVVTEIFDKKEKK